MYMCVCGRMEVGVMFVPFTCFVCYSDYAPLLPVLFNSVHRVPPLL